MMKRMMIAVLMTGCAACCSTQGASRREATATRAARKPRVDGKLVDACWRDATWQTGFTRINSTEPADQQTSFAVLYDENNLYIGIRCNENAVGDLRAKAKERDDEVWEDDCVEITLMPAKELNPDPNYIEYHHFIVNSIGTQFDRVMKAGSGVPWDGEWKADAHIGDDRWSVELVIPFSTLNITHETGADWLFNVCRSRLAGKGGASAWSPTGSSFHVPTEFARLTGLEVAFKQYAYAINTLNVTPAEGAFSVQMNVGNQSSFSGMLRADLAFLSSRGRVYSSKANFETHADKNRNVTVGPFAFAESDAYRLYATLKRSGGHVVKRVIRNVDIVVSPLRVGITQPTYRQTIYHTQQIDELHATATVNTTEAERKQYALESSLVNWASGEKMTAATVAELTELNTHLRIPVKDLPVGQYVLVTILTKDGQVIASDKTDVAKLGKAPGAEVRVGDDLALRVDGEPYFPFGFLATGGSDDRIVKSGFNTVQNYTLHYGDVAEVKAHLDRLHALGQKILVVPFHRVRHDFHGFGSRNAIRETLTDEEWASMRQFVKELSTHPALLGWYISDEPRGATHIRTLENAYREIREIDPFHPVIALDNSASGCLGLAEAADILLLNPFPDFLQGQRESVAPLTIISGGTEVIYQGLDGSMPVWVCPQAFDRSLLRIGSNYRAPTYLEVRCMTYLALVRNAKGVLYYAYGMPNWRAVGRPGNSGIYASASLEIGMLQGVGPEIQAMMPALAQPLSSRSVTASNKHILVLLREGEKDLCLIAVNPYAKETTCKLFVEGLGRRALHVVAEGRTLMSTGKGVLDDAFGPHAVHVYTTDAALSKLRTVQEVQRMISEAQTKPNARWK